MGLSIMTQEELVEQVRLERRFRNRFRAYMSSLFSNWTATLGFIIILGFYSLAILADAIAPFQWYDHNWDKSYLEPPGPDFFTFFVSILQGVVELIPRLIFNLINTFLDILNEITENFLGFVILFRFEIIPSNLHMLGTDWAGQDVFSRVVFGSRTAVLAGFISIGVGLTGGTLLGATSGYLGGTVDNIVMRIVDAWMSIPSFFMLLIIVAAVSDMVGAEYTLFVAMFFIGFMGIPGYARIIRGNVLAVREMDFVDAARSTGASEIRIISKHIIPNVLPIILIYATMGIGGAVMSTSGLSFIGLGARPNQPDWGGDMNLARADFLTGKPWTTFFPGLAIFVVVLGFNLIGDWLRDVLDPRTRDI